MTSPANPLPSFLSWFDGLCAINASTAQSLPAAVQPAWDPARGFCLLATRNITQGDLAFCVPEDAVITVQRAREDQEFAKVLEKVREARREAEIEENGNGDDDGDAHGDAENEDAELDRSADADCKPNTDTAGDVDMDVDRLIANPAEDDGLVLFLLYESLKARVHGSSHRGTEAPPLVEPLPPSVASLPDSFWTPYLAILPRSFPTSPVYWSDEDLDRRLAGSPLLWQARAVLDNLRENWTAAREIVAGVLGEDVAKEGFEWDEFLWAYMVVQTRAYKVKRSYSSSSSSPASTGNGAATGASTPLDFSSRDMFLCLMPFADFANHSVTAETATVGEICRIETPRDTSSAHGEDDGSGAPHPKRRRTSESPTSHPAPQWQAAPKRGVVRAVAKQAKSAGEEVVIHYNDLANWQLLLYYGFTLPDNPFDRVNVDLDVDFFVSSGSSAGSDALDEDEDDEQSSDTDSKKLLLFQIALDSHSWCRIDHSLGPLASSSGSSDSSTRLGPVPHSLIATLRLLVASPGELADDTIHTLDRFSSGPISPRNERAVVDAVAALVDALEASYVAARDCSVQEEQTRLDEAVRAAESSGWDPQTAAEVYALQYVVGQRVVCNEVRRWAVERRAELEQ
ncbi:SET domain-containing protein [Gonapodya prolifera JEL478]|uniref:SET domain-containing protein n=1 Tax=Gonapodya prolifera (strain JEL478) TaxID=1344416 RepID=A0A139ADU9_GONPJ|nr:SET domain-containing protein [Gonapodya prolifera JEL478]|eukprot:KXS14615.1 SET domain-containing protein [Gonapodya prolifera JEL478]